MSNKKIRAREISKKLASNAHFLQDKAMPAVIKEIMSTEGIAGKDKFLQSLFALPEAQSIVKEFVSKAMVDLSDSVVVQDAVTEGLDVHFDEILQKITQPHRFIVIVLDHDEECIHLLDTGHGLVNPSTILIPTFVLVTPTEELVETTSHRIGSLPYIERKTNSWKKEEGNVLFCVCSTDYLRWLVYENKHPIESIVFYTTYYNGNLYDHSHHTYQDLDDVIDMAAENKIPLAQHANQFFGVSLFSEISPTRCQEDIQLMHDNMKRDVAKENLKDKDKKEARVALDCYFNYQRQTRCHPHQCYDATNPYRFELWLEKTRVQEK